MNMFWIKLLNFLLVIAVILGYNGILYSRKQAETIAQLEFELENQQQINLAQQQTVQTTDSNYQDGVYEGSAEGFGGPIVMQTVIENGKLTELNIISADKEDEAYLDAASALIEQILEEQSADVDTVSGATFSSNGIINATAEALRKAEGAK